VIGAAEFCKRSEFDHGIFLLICDLELFSEGPGALRPA
jgi:hypothetical protein